jgi:hypothetical protein
MQLHYRLALVLDRFLRLAIPLHLTLVGLALVFKFQFEVRSLLLL